MRPLTCLATLTPMALTVGLVMTGCGGPGGGTVPGPSQSMVVSAPNQSVFLRVSFDDDPSPFIGRFIPDGLTPDQIDENRATTTRCSEFITVKQVKASGTFDEVFNSATSVSASLGLTPPAIGSASAG
ncbi:MAG: hypothetical protein AAFS10_12245, partial [Myxococcota bacterium]